MKNMVYIGKTFKQSIAFIRVNTDWVQISPCSFNNGDETINVMTRFQHLRGQKFDGVYVDYSFTSLSDIDYQLFTERFHTLGIKPIHVYERGI